MELTIFENTGIRFQENEVYATRSQVEELYTVPRKTLEDNINKLKEDGHIIGRKSAMSSEIAGRSYDTEVYNLKEILAIGMRLRSEKAIEFQKWALDVLEEKFMEGQKQLRMQQAQLDWFWDKQDNKDLYS